MIGVKKKGMNTSVYSYKPKREIIQFHRQISIVSHEETYTQKCDARLPISVAVGFWDFVLILL